MNMHHVSIIEKDGKGNVQRGIDFWHVPGADIYLYQRWVYRSGQIECGQTLPDPVLRDPRGVSDLLHTVRECWLSQTGMVFNPGYPLDMDYR